MNDNRYKSEQGEYATATWCLKNSDPNGAFYIWSVKQQGWVATDGFTMRVLSEREFQR